METHDYHGAVSLTADIRPGPTGWSGEYAVWGPDGRDGHHHIGPAPHDELTAQIYTIASDVGAL